MADRLLAGLAVGIRDVPRKGLVVRIIDSTGNVVADLDPGQAAELGGVLGDLASDAVHESRARRRTTPSS